MNIGDKIIFTRSDISEIIDFYEIEKIYKISDIRENKSSGNLYQIFYGEEKYMNFWFTRDCFISLAEWRDIQIDLLFK